MNPELCGKEKLIINSQWLISKQSIFSV